MRRDSDQSLVFVWVGAIVLLLLRLPLLPHRLLDPDELEHSHAAWCLWKGMLPYRDFFEHHTPWYYYTLRPLFRWFDVDGSFEAAKSFLIAGRGLSLALAVLSVWLVARLGRLWPDRRVGVTAALLLAAQPLFLRKSLEMRPDLLALPFYLGALGFLLRGIARPDAETKRLWSFVVGGLCFGAANMCTQKMLFVLPGLLAGLVVWTLSAGDAWRRLGLLASFVAAAVLPGLLTWAIFALQHSGDAFITNNFLLNAHWRRTPTRQLGKLLKTSAPVLVLALVGIAGAARRFVRAAHRDHGEVMLACTALGLFAGVLVIPVAQAQYYLMPLPIVCLFAAKALFSLADRFRRRTLPLAVTTIGLAVLPVIGLCEAFTTRNDEQLARLRRVFETTERTDLVMDGWEGTGVFRPHAFYYFFIHDEIPRMLDRARLDAYLGDLESGRVRPKLIALDRHLVGLGPRFLRFVEDHYASDDGFLYVARGEARSAL